MRKEELIIFVDQLLEKGGRGPVFDKCTTFFFSLLAEVVELRVRGYFSVEKQACGDVGQALPEVSGFRESLPTASFEEAHRVIADGNPHGTANTGGKADDVGSRPGLEEDGSIVPGQVADLQAKAIGDGFDHLRMVVRHGGW